MRLVWCFNMVMHTVQGAPPPTSQAAGQPQQPLQQRPRNRTNIQEAGEASAVDFGARETHGAGADPQGESQRNPPVAGKARSKRAETNQALAEPGAIATLATEDLCRCCKCNCKSSMAKTKCQCVPHCEYTDLTFEERRALITAAHKYHASIPARYLTRILQGELVTNARIKDGNVAHGPFILERISLCVEAYRAVVGWSRNVWFSAKAKVRSHLISGKTSMDAFDVDLESNEPKHREASTRAYGWCHGRLDEIADGVDPSSRGPKAAQRMLDRQDLNEWYLEYLQAMEDRGDFETISPSTFTKMYSLARKELNIMDRAWIPFAQCQHCAELKLKMSKATTKVHDEVGRGMD